MYFISLDDHKLIGLNKFLMDTTQVNAVSLDEDEYPTVYLITALRDKKMCVLSGRIF